MFNAQAHEASGISSANLILDWGLRGEAPRRGGCAEDSAGG
jgi:hypothetical protein